MGVYDNLVQQQRSLQKQLEFERLGALGGGGVGVPGSAPGSGGREGGGLSGGRQHDFDYNRDTPLVPMYSVLPYIREDDYVRVSPGGSSTGDQRWPPSSGIRWGVGTPGPAASACAHRRRTCWAAWATSLLRQPPRQCHLGLVSARFLVLIRRFGLSLRK